MFATKRCVACVAQADVRKYYDSLPMLRLLYWLLHKGADKTRVMACMRHQLMTQIKVRLPLANKCSVIRNRIVGGLTGSRVAGSLARIPIEEMLVTFADSWIAKGFAKQVTVASWIDNLLAFSSSIGGAIGMLEECENHLERPWNLQFKQGSTEFLVVWGSMDDELVSERWRKVDVFNSLGHRIEHTGSIQ